MATHARRDAAERTFSLSRSFKTERSTACVIACRNPAVWAQSRSTIL